MLSFSPKPARQEKKLKSFVHSQGEKSQGCFREEGGGGNVDMAVSIWGGQNSSESFVCEIQHVFAKR